MFQIPFGILLKEAREQAGLTCGELAQLAGYDKRRVSALERSQRSPRPEEVATYLRALPLNPNRVHYSLQSPSDLSRILKLNASRLLEGRPYFPPAPEPAHRRFLSALGAFPDLVKPIVARLRKRADFLQIFSLTDRMRFDSADEVLSCLNIFDMGAVPALYAPNTCAALPAVVVDKTGKERVGHRPHACMIIENLVIFHQVTFATNPIQTVDLLVWDGAEWRVWEVDGTGHVSRKDEERRRALGLAVQRFQTASIEQAAQRGEPYFARFLRMAGEARPIAA